MKQLCVSFGVLRLSELGLEMFPLLFLKRKLSALNDSLVSRAKIFKLIDQLHFALKLRDLSRLVASEILRIRLVFAILTWPIVDNALANLSVEKKTY